MELRTLHVVPTNILLFYSRYNGQLGRILNKSPPTEQAEELSRSSWKRIELFFLQRAKFTLANRFSLLADKVGEIAVNERSHQYTLERYFITK